MTGVSVAVRGNSPGVGLCGGPPVPLLCNQDVVVSSIPQNALNQLGEQQCLHFLTLADIAQV